MKFNRMLTSLLALGLVTGVAQADKLKGPDDSHDSKMRSEGSATRNSSTREEDVGLDNAEDRGSDRGQERKEAGMDQAQSREERHDNRDRKDRDPTEGRHRGTADSSKKH